MPTVDRPKDSMFGPLGPNTGILWISVLSLFLELLLIRWVSTELRIFAYLQNTVLVVCFLGLGVGLFTARRRIAVGNIGWPLLVVTAFLAFPPSRQQFHKVSEMLSVLGDLTIWYQGSASNAFDAIGRVSLGLSLTFVVMALIIVPFVPIGRALGRLLDDHPRPVLAYSINVAGSLLGIWLFVLLSWLERSPVIWFAALGLLLLPFLMSRRPRRWIHAVPVILLLVFSSSTTNSYGAIETVWSPYQKLELYKPVNPAPGTPSYRVTVNNVGYQLMLDLRRETIAEAPDAYPMEQVGYSQYDIPFLVHPNPANVLIVGAGAGNDVAGALRHGARHVTAVEIDPSIIRLGRQYHPERPYQSERVRIVNDDARSFFARTDETFDVILFGLLDSHTTTSMTNARLDHYVYTRESIQRARELLAENGVMVLSFEAEKPFISDRIAGVLKDVFSDAPIIFRVPFNTLGWGGVMFLNGDLEVVRPQIAADPGLGSLIASWQRRNPVDPSYSTVQTTDDWPYIYLEQRQIPRLYFLLAGLMVLLFVIVRKSVGAAGLNPRRWSRSHWHFFFLGGAFLLLEVQNISKAAVALGNTWWVNAVIISGVLIMVLLANVLVTIWPRIPLRAVYAGLIGSVLGLYFVDLARFAFLPYGLKAIVVGGLTTLPMLFSGIVFVKSFAQSARKDLAFGANLFGALAGALLQSISFIVGIKALLLIVAVLYALAMLTQSRKATLAQQRKILPSTIPGGAHVV